MITAPRPSAGFASSWVVRIMEAMDWGDASDFVRFGAVGPDHVDDCAYYILIAPQNVAGTTIMGGLTQMVIKGSPPTWDSHPHWLYSACGMERGTVICAWNCATLRACWRCGAQL